MATAAAGGADAEADSWAVLFSAATFLSVESAGGAAVGCCAVTSFCSKRSAAGATAGVAGAGVEATGTDTDAGASSLSSLTPLPVPRSVGEGRFAGSEVALDGVRESVLSGVAGSGRGAVAALPGAGVDTGAAAGVSEGLDDGPTSAESPAEGMTAGASVRTGSAAGLAASLPLAPAARATGVVNVGAGVFAGSGALVFWIVETRGLSFARISLRESGVLRDDGVLEDLSQSRIAGVRSFAGGSPAARAGATAAAALADATPADKSDDGRTAGRPAALISGRPVGLADSEEPDAGLASAKLRPEIETPAVGAVILGPLVKAVTGARSRSSFAAGAVAGRLLEEKPAAEAGAPLSLPALPAPLVVVVVVG